ncbi:FAS1-like dehydratase domain-containing protein [Achromobacter aloeverae]
MAEQPQDLGSWIGRTETLNDLVTETPVRGLRALLDIDDKAIADLALLPPAWHWMFFAPIARQSEIGADGHPRRGGFLPPVALPRRMWAGSELQFHRPIRVGDSLARTSRIADVREKAGRTGPLVFVTVNHELSVDGALAISERQDIVYREMPQADEPAPASVAAPADAQWTRRIVPDPVMLFRYSALTFNGHRIHYDRSYATSVEHYPGLVVHGPLIATLLLDLLRRELPDATVTHFKFRAVKPLIDTQSFHVCGRMEDAETVKLWAKNENGDLTMDAVATVAR